MAFTEVDEKLLVRAYQAGDERAFDTIVRTQHKALFAHALRRLSNHEAAEDAVQDTLLRAYRALPNLDGDLALRAWLHRILTNVCHDEGNRRRRQAGLVEKIEGLPEELVDDPGDEAVLHDTVRIMSEALQELPENYREALVLRYVDGLSFREVAEAAGVTEENARARVHRGRAALHKIMTRVAIVLAFLIPGLRRTQTTPGAEQAAASPAATDSGVALMTQLTSHAVHAAPHAGRLVEMATMTSGTKSALVTTAVAAVAAVGVTGGAVAVHEARKPERPPAITAAPAPPAAQQKGAPSAGDPGVRSVAALTQEQTDETLASTTTSSSTTSTSSTLPPSATKPFQVTPETSEGDDSTSPSTTSPESPPTSEAPPEGSAPTVAGAVDAAVLEAVSSGPNFDVSGPLTLTVEERSVPGTLDGRLSLYDDGVAAGELSLTVDGTAYPLRFRGSIVERVAENGATTWSLQGKYSLAGGADLGLAESGDVESGSFRHGDDGTAGLRLELRGPAPSEPESTDTQAAETSDTKGSGTEGPGTKGAKGSVTPTSEPASADDPATTEE